MLDSEIAASTYAAAIFNFSIFAFAPVYFRERGKFSCRRLGDVIFTCVHPGESQRLVLITTFGNDCFRQSQRQSFPASYVSLSNLSHFSNFLHSVLTVL